MVDANSQATPRENPAADTGADSADTSARIDSRATTPEKTTPDNTAEDATADSPAAEVENGGVSSVEASGSAGSEAARPREAKVTVRRRLLSEGRWLGRIELERDDMMRDCRARGMTKVEAQAWTYAELDRLYPALPVEAVAAPAMQAGQIQGLDSIPIAWPVLPANASQQAELEWVQANRLLMVEERPGGATVVKLERALSSAPSHAALGWLETSIRSYAKFVDVVSRTLKDEADDQDMTRRERMALDGIRRLLDEMHRDDPTPHDK